MRRARARPGTLERPISTRLYRAAWLAVAIPLLVTAFTVGRPEPLPAPRLEPTFDGTTALGFASELARRFPDRTPGSAGARDSADWMAARFRDVGLKPERDTFRADLPGLGEQELENLLAVTPGRTPETIVVMAHRDNSGRSPGANDNASGTAALLELARNAEVTSPAHTLVFLSTDGGAFGAAGAARFASDRGFLKRLVGGSASVVAVVDLDAIAGRGPPRIVFAGEAARTPAATLLATADASVERETDRRPERPGALGQLIDLGFPFTVHEQGAFVARGTAALTLTTGAERPAAPEDDTLEAFAEARFGDLGRSAQLLVLSLDASAEVARGTDSFVYLGPRILRGWAIQFLLLAALVPFLAATVDLFARCRRRHVPLWPALRSLVSRAGIWLWTGALFALFALAGLLADGDARPPSPASEVAGDWPVAALAALGALSALGWLVARPRLARRGPVSLGEEVGGHLAAMLVLAVVALVVAATNPYALLFVLPSLHAWLWLPHVPRAAVPLRLGLFAAGLAGPLALVGSFAVRFGLGLDAPWYLLSLAAVGYVTPPLVVAALVWAAAAGQVGALALGRYAPYPRADERPPRGPVREAIRRAVLASRRRRARAAIPPLEPEPEVLEEPS